MRHGWDVCASDFSSQLALLRISTSIASPLRIPGAEDHHGFWRPLTQPSDNVARPSRGDININGAICITLNLYDSLCAR